MNIDIKTPTISPTHTRSPSDSSSFSQDEDILIVSLADDIFQKKGLFYTGFGRLTSLNNTISVKGFFEEGKIKNCATIKIFFSSGAIYKGPIIDQKAQGMGKLVFTNGSHFSGFWKEGRPFSGLLSIYKEHELIKRTYSEGTLSRNVIITNYNSKDTYKGEIVDDQRTRGEQTYESQSIISYSGEWNKNCYHGNGKLNYSEKSSYEGKWENNERSGRGIYREADSLLYSGEWKKDLPEGQGILKLGTVSYEGEWYRGRAHGSGKILSQRTGKILYSGTWNKGKPDGTGYLYSYQGPDKIKIESVWKDKVFDQGPENLWEICCSFNTNKKFKENSVKK